MTKCFIALFCSILIIMLPIALAEEAKMDEPDEQDTGETIIVNVKSYEPAVLKSSLIEDDDVDIYAFLTGYTLGSALSNLAKFSQQKDSPFYGQPEIKQVKARPLNSDTEELVRNIRYMRPLKYTLDDLGTLVIRLKQVPAEAEVPNSITLDFDAEIYFENAERLFSLIQQDLVIPEDKDETTWKEERNPEEYSFFSGRGFIRATEITPDSASFVVYETQGYKEQPSGILSSIAVAIKKFVQTRSVTLKAGETSEYMRFNEMDFVPENAFRIKLNSITDPQQEKAKVRVGVDGKLQNLILYEGMPLFSGSSYRVASIEEKADPKGEQRRYEIAVQGPLGTFTATKTFTPTKNKVYLPKIYQGTAAMIKPFQISDLPTKIGAYFPGVKFDIPILTSLDITNQFQIEKDMTLAQVLEAVLPTKYIAVEEEDAVTIKLTKDAISKDICDGKAIVLNTEEDIKTAQKENVICTAIAEYKELIKDHGDESSPSGATYRDLANYKIGMLYEELYKTLPDEEQLSAGELAISYLEKSATISELSQDLRSIIYEKISELKKSIESGAQHKIAIFEDNGREISLMLNEIIQTPANLKPQTNIQIEGKGTSTYGIGDSVITADDSSYTWRIKNLGTNDVTLEKVALKTADIRSNIETIRVKTPTKIDGKSLNVLDIQLHKQAYISIIPGTGDPLMSKTNFTLHIPIEKRLIPLSPETIDQQLNQTQYWIDELEKITTELDSIVETWNTVCLATFAYLTIKNSFFMGLGRTQARKDVIYGLDGSSGWAEFCSASKLYSDYDACIRANEDKIETQIDETQKAKEKLDDEMENYEDQQWYKELTADYDQINKYGKYAGGFFTEEELRNYRYNQLLKETGSYSSSTDEAGKYNFKTEVDRKSVDFTNANSDMKQAYNNAVSAMANFPANAAEEQQIFNDLYSQNLQDLSKKDIITSDEFRELNKNTVTAVPLLRTQQNGKAYINTPSGRVDLEQAKVSDYITMLESGVGAPGKDTDALINEIDRMDEKYKKNLNAPLSTSQGAIYVDSAGKLYASIATYDLSKINTEYTTRTAQFYPDGKPYCIPTSNGNYVKVLSFFADGSPNLVQLWNIGPDGEICSNDDIPIKHETLLNLPENEQEQRDLRSKAARVGTHGEGEVISIGGIEFTISTSTAKLDKQAGEASCYDVMDPDDCSTLFGVCDPVMCPSSRFNLGGTYQVDNVVQSGIIGSLVLGLHNFNIKEPVPICITGVLAGLKNIQSVLEGYVQCLKEAQATGKSVGICDQIRSVFICDIIYREVVSLLDAKGGILTWMAKTVFGEGGGEYLNFQNSLQNVQKSVSFFTQSYSKTAFAAYRGRTTEELGTTICSAAIYGKLPELGEMVSELTKPESPPQFMAKLSVAPHSESATIKKEAYEIFYHIYAGEDKKADYTVFLRNRIEDTYYATEKCEGRGGTIEAGGIATHNLNCVADSGFDEVCVTINGITECGFGKVTSAFSLNYLNDLIVEDEATKGISTEEDCVPDNQRYSSPVQSMISGEALGATGIVRVCSIQNPGQGTNPESWKAIGTCGKDTAGRSIGSCWIDLRTVSIHDTERMENTQRALQEAGLNTTKISQGATYLLDKEASEAELARLSSLKGTATTLAQKFELMQAYTALKEQSLSLAVAAEAQYQSASITSELSAFSLETTAKPTTTTEEITLPGLTITLSNCNKCDADLLGICSLDECHQLNPTNCAFIKEPVPWWTVVGLVADNNNCFSCDEADSCSNFNYDKAQCRNSKCTQQAGLECTWLQIRNEGICSNKFLGSGTPTPGNIVAMPKIDKVTTAGSLKIDALLIPKIQEVADNLQEGETLRITSAARTLEKQKELFKKYVTKQTNNVACPSSLAKELRDECTINTWAKELQDCHFSDESLAKIDDPETYKSCPHVAGTAIDVYLCDSKKTESTITVGDKDPKDACGNLGYENSVKLQNLMCNAGWAGYAPERWHYEYGSIAWKNALDTGECIFGKERIDREDYQVVSPV